MNTRSLETLSKQEIRNYQGDSFYILNTSDKNGTESRAELLMTFRISGDPETIEIKNTWIPLDLMTRAPLNEILNNKDFWHHINKKQLAVISEEAAEAVLETDAAQEEYDRVYEINEDDKRLNKNTDTIDMQERSMEKHRGKLAKGNLKKELGSTKVIAIMKKENLTETNRLAALRNIQHELTTDDYKYIVQEARSENQERIKEWATLQGN